MAKNDNTLLYVAGAAALYFLFIKPKTAVPAPVVVPLPGGVAVPVVATNPVSSILNAVTSVVKNLGSGGSQTFVPQAPIPDAVEELPTPVLTNQLAVSPTANVIDDNVRNMINSDFYTQYQQSLISGLHSDGYMG